MQQLKRIISMVLLVAILVGMVPAAVQAEQTDTAVANTGTTIEGTNGFGALLSEDIQEQQETNEESADSGYNVVGLQIENGIATVAYSSLEEAILVVSLYTEDGVKMLLSGKTVVSPEETEAAITLEGEIPEYFMAAAYLLDTYDHSPLCTAYETPMYTQEMQELLASTVDDYDADKVLQLGDDKTTNFAVYTDSTIVLGYVEGVNTVVSADDETATYVIENADSTVTGLQPGNILAYAYGEEQILIVKVETITVDGTTVTITGTDVEMEEVFSHVKIEAAGDTADMTVDETGVDEGVTYIGMVEEPALMSLSDPYGVNTVDEKESVSGEVSAGFELEKESGPYKLTGSLMMKIELELSFYITWSRQFIEFKATAESELAVEVSGKAPFELIKLGSLGYSPIPGVYAGFEPTVSLIFSAKVSVGFTTSETIGFSCDSALKGEKIKDLSTPMKVDFTLDMEGTIFFGLDMGPKVRVLDGWILETDLSTEIGLELKGEMEGTSYDDVSLVGNGETPESIHNCEKCLKVELYLKLEMGVSLKFLKVIKAETKLTLKSFPLGQWYRSGDYGGFEKGSCPNLSYRVTVSVSDANSKRVAGSAVTAMPEGQTTEITIGSTNNSGIVANYLPAGNYTFTAWVSGQPVRNTVIISGASKVTLNKQIIDDGLPTFSGSIDPDAVIDYSSVIASGECGDNGNNVLWSLSSSGLLTISGQGAMKDYTEGNRPWEEHCFLIKKVTIEDGITTIGDFAFIDCEWLTSVTIPDSVSTIGEHAFVACYNLTSVTIPNSVTTIGNDAFRDCDSLTSVTIPDSVTTISDSAFYNCDSLTSISIPNSVTTIGEYAFEDCCSLTSVTIGNSVTTIGEAAFSGCDSLTSVTIPDSVTTIGEYAFYNCDSLTSISIPNSVTTIGENAFSNCDRLTGIWVDADNPNYSSDPYGVLFNKDKTLLIKAPGAISNYTIPGSVTTIDDYAFYFCTSLTSATIPDSVTTIDGWAFSYCDSLTSVTIGNSVTTIGDYAFRNCSSLTSVTIGNSVTTIGEAAFYQCTSLTSVTIPDSVTTIGNYAFEDCNSLTSVTIPDSVTAIGEGAFSYSDSLTSISIPNSVITIGNSAFRNCNSLTSVTIGNSVTSIGEYAFEDCNSLTSVTIGNSVTSIGEAAFCLCESLTSITIPNSVITIGKYAFDHCNSLTSIIIPDSVIAIGEYAFNYCTSLTSVTILDSVTTIGNWAFLDCWRLTSVTIGNSVTSIGEHAFYRCTSLTDVYYSGTQTQWNAISIGISNDPLKNATIHYNSSAAAASAVAMASLAAVSSDGEDSLTDEEYTAQESGNTPSLYSIFDGEYETEITDTYTLKHATFSGLVPGEEYVLLSLVSVELDDVLVPENLLYIDQAAAAEDGTLTFAYAQREDTAVSYVVACGPSHQDLADAEITFPVMPAKKDLQAVHPSVVYNGETLIEGVDYVISGAVDYTAAGEYTCYIRGIYDYTGLVECVYTVMDAAASVTAEQETVYYETMEEALQAYSEGSVFALQKNVESDFAASQNMLLDLNGYSITGNVSANSDVELVVMDSQTDDYTIEDENGYGKITGTVSGIQAQDGYMMITEEDGVSFHCVNLALKAMTLRPAQAGVYYKSDFAGDELVAANVKQFGVALSIRGVPTAENMETDCAYSVFTTFEAGRQDETTTSTLLKGILKTTNSKLINFRNASLPIYGRAYILTTDGEYIFGASVSRTFREQVEAADTIWSQLSEAQKTGMEQIYEEFEYVMNKWTLPNLKKAIA